MNKIILPTVEPTKSTIQPRILFVVVVPELGVVFPFGESEYDAVLLLDQIKGNGVNAFIKVKRENQ